MQHYLNLCLIVPKQIILTQIQYYYICTLILKIPAINGYQVLVCV